MFPALPKWPLVAALPLLLSCSTVIPIDRYPPQQTRAVDSRLNQPDKLPPVSFSILETAHASTLEAFFVRGGSWFRGRRISHSVVVVRHPQGLLLIDTGLGQEIEQQFAEEMPWTLRWLTSFENPAPARDQLQAAGIHPSEVREILLTHLHWDHAGGIKDFPQARVWHPQEGIEEALAIADEDSAFFLSQIDGPDIQWQSFGFPDGPYESFPASKDFYGDGTIVLVPMPGHTATSLGVFLNLRDGRRFLFSGDATWALEGFQRPSHKFCVSSWLVDLDQEMLATSIVRVHRLLQEIPSLHVVPTHDSAAQEGLAHLPLFEGAGSP